MKKTNNSRNESQKNPMLSEKRFKFFRSMFLFALGLLSLCAIGLILMEVL